MTTFNIYQRETLDQTPVQIATGLTSKNYSISGLTEGKKYLFSVGAEKNGIEKLSDEKIILFGQEWTPENLINPAKIRYDSDNVVKDESNRISQVNDLSAGGFNATQSTNANKPLFERGSISFDGENDFMNITTGLNLLQNVNYAYVFAVVSKNSIDSGDIERVVVGYSINSSPFRFGLTLGNTASGNKNKIVFGGRRLDSDAFDGVTSTFNVSAHRDYIVCGIIDYSARTISLYVDGLLNVSKTGVFSGAGNTSNTESLRARLGANLGVNPSTFGDVSIKQVIINNQVLTEIDRQKLEGWAAHKYGLTDNLPIDHPYKTLVPTL